MKKIICVLLCLIMVLYLSACGENKKENLVINIGVLNGPTGMGALGLMKKADSGEFENYKISLIADPTDIVAKLSNGELQIGALPTNLAANLYNKTNGQIKIIALNTLGVLYMLQNGNSVKDYEDLKGKTIYSAGQGSNPEYILKYILQENGVNPDEDVNIVFAEASDITTKMLSGEAEICMLPVPAATALQIKSENINVLFDMTDEYDKIAKGSSVLTMGCIVARTDFIDANETELRTFLEDYNQSIYDVKNNADAYAKLAADYGLVPAEGVAKKAIPQCNMVFISGVDIKPSLEGYLSLLFDADPSSIGGKMPGDDLYFE